STVYRAFDPTLERWVAIKLMHRDISQDPDQLERFRREARAVAQLNHAHVVTVIDAGEDDGAPYIVFEYVEGETLKERIRRLGRLPIDEAIAYAIEIGRALECAHSHRLVHRDVKPQNVLIDPDGRATLDKVVSGEADAGLVYASDAVAAGDDVEAVEIPGAEEEPTTYFTTTLQQSADPGLAAKWVDLVTSEEGGTALTEAGFTLP
ncbi:MAG: extracellular solute-binding protein, partial [Nocardioides sp.]